MPHAARRSSNDPAPGLRDDDRQLASEAARSPIPVIQPARQPPPARARPPGTPRTRRTPSRAGTRQGRDDHCRPSSPGRRLPAPQPGPRRPRPTWRRRPGTAPPRSAPGARGACGRRPGRRRTPWPARRPPRSHRRGIHDRHPCAREMSVVHQVEGDHAERHRPPSSGQATRKRWKARAGARRARRGRRPCRRVARAYHVAAPSSTDRHHTGHGQHRESRPRCPGQAPDARDHEAGPASAPTWSSGLVDAEPAATPDRPAPRRRGARTSRASGSPCPCARGPPSSTQTRARRRRERRDGHERHADHVRRTQRRVHDQYRPDSRPAARRTSGARGPPPRLRRDQSDHQRRGAERGECERSPVTANGAPS